MRNADLRDPGLRQPSERHDLDRVRELLEGTLPPDEREALLARVAADPELAELVQAYRDVDVALGPISTDGSACRVTFDDLERRMPASAGGSRLRDSWGRRGPWAVAAVLLLALGWVGMRAMRTAGDDATVHLEAIAAPTVAPSPDRGAEAALACAEELADHVPLRDGEVGWIPSLAQGRAVARVTGRPVLLYIHHPICPICEELEAGPLRDPDVRERIARFAAVKVRASFEDMDPDLDRDWPYFAVLSPEGIVLDERTVPASTAEFTAFLDDQIARRVPASVAPWDHVRELAWRLREAMRLDRGRDLARSEPLLGALASDPDAGPFASAARELLARRARDAYERLRDAAVAYAALADPQAAVLRLDAAIAEMSGTPYARDLAAVRDALVRTGRFPRLDPIPLPLR